MTKIFHHRPHELSVKRIASPFIKEQLEANEPTSNSMNIDCDRTEVNCANNKSSLLIAKSFAAPQVTVTVHIELIELEDRKTRDQHATESRRRILFRFVFRLDFSAFKRCERK